MRKIFLVIIIFLVLVINIGGRLLDAANDYRERFEQAGRLYEEGKYTAALAIYQDIEKSVSHWKLFYNTGNCYYKSGSFIKAKIYYLKAERLNPFEPSIEKNIAVVDQQFSDKIAAESPDFLSRLALRFESLVSLNAVSVILLFAIIVLNVFIFMLIKKGKSRFLLYGVAFSLVIVLIIAGYHIYRTGKQELRDTAVITKENSELRSGPGENNTILFKVYPGLKVKIIEKSRHWVQVSASSQVAGWLEEDRLERI
ncbi:MAG: SH3 domain-containing protein [Acidobacteria bacterium]|jgi:tetratricopeptide (TPR) repeat protein|nr:SH3 domain-containing protein [Acidobacteriota bacterium]